MRPHRDQDIREARALYVANRYSIRAIAVALGRSYGYVHRILTEAHTPMRPRGGANRKAKP